MPLSFHLTQQKKRMLTGGGEKQNFVPRWTLLGYIVVHITTTLPQYDSFEYDKIPFVA